MIVFNGSYFHNASALRSQLLEAPEVRVGEWHSQTLPQVDAMVTRELRDVSIEFPLPDDIKELQEIIGPNLPWAENHFQERVGGEPLNPPPSAEEWPYAERGHQAHVDEAGEFSHTYPERMWAKTAGSVPHPSINYGIRFPYGDLMDVVNLLHREPLTRQAYLPIWFPEDTGAAHGERVPCSLGYHFLIRDNEVNITYMIRSCDFVRHFADDVYMAARLCQWVREQLVAREGPDDLPVGDLHVGTLTMHTMSMHIFNGDVARLQREPHV